MRQNPMPPKPKVKARIVTPKKPNYEADRDTEHKVWALMNKRRVERTTSSADLKNSWTDLAKNSHIYSVVELVFKI